MAGAADGRGFGFGPNAEAGPSRWRTRSTSIASEESASAASASGASRRQRRGQSRSGSSSISLRADTTPSTRRTSASTAADDGLEWYIADLGQHMRESAATAAGHLPTRDGTAGTYHFGELDAGPVPPSGTLWAADEKRRFFAALARHSRLRPDLIAADVRTKNEYAVQEYLAVLKHGAEHGGKRYKGAGGEARAWRDHLLWSGVGQVDSAFVEREARLAERVEEMAAAAIPPPLEFRRRATDSDNILSWGAELDDGKLEALGTLLDEAETTRISDLEGLHVPDAVDDELALSIAKDNDEIAIIQAIEKRARTPAQRTRLRTLLNRRSMRERTRIKVLLEQGFTRQQIENAGGADKLYTAHNGSKKRRGKRKPPTQIKDTDAEVQHLAGLHTEAFLTERGWEVLNYHRIAEMLRASAQEYDEAVQTSRPQVKKEPSPEPSTSASPASTSFSVVGDLYTELLAYLKPLIYTTIMIAEQHLPQTDDIEVSPAHVIAALGLRGELAKLQQEARATRGSSRSRRGSAVSFASETPILADTTPDPGSAPPSAPSSAPNSPSLVPVSWVAASADVLLDREELDESDTDLESDDSDSDVETLTDEEDAELDKLLDRADSCLDAILSNQLREALEDGNSKLLVDEWRHSSRRGPKRKTRPVNEGLAAALKDAEDDYSIVALQWENTRRKRARRKTLPESRRSLRAKARALQRRPKREPSLDIESEEEQRDIMAAGWGRVQEEYSEYEGEQSDAILEDEESDAILEEEESDAIVRDKDGWGARDTDFEESSDEDGDRESRIHDGFGEDDERDGPDAYGSEDELRLVPPDDPDSDADVAGPEETVPIASDDDLESLPSHNANDHESEEGSDPAGSGPRRSPTWEAVAPPRTYRTYKRVRRARSETEEDELESSPAPILKREPSAEPNGATDDESDSRGPPDEAGMDSMMEVDDELEDLLEPEIQIQSISQTQTQTQTDDVVDTQHTLPPPETVDDTLASQVSREEVQSSSDWDGDR